jgi:hypothetical protein
VQKSLFIQWASWALHTVISGVHEGDRRDVRPLEAETQSTQLMPATCVTRHATSPALLRKRGHLACCAAFVTTAQPVVQVCDQQGSIPGCAHGHVYNHLCSHCAVIQSSFTTLRILCAQPVHISTLSPLETTGFHCLHACGFPDARVDIRQCMAFSDWVFHLVRAFKVPHCFSWLDSSPVFSTEHSHCPRHSIHSSSPLVTGILVTSSFGDYEQRCCKDLCRFLCQQNFQSFK